MSVVPHLRHLDAGIGSIILLISTFCFGIISTVVDLVLGYAFSIAKMCLHFKLLLLYSGQSHRRFV